jgi:acetyl esterase/lipase
MEEAGPDHQLHSAPADLGIAPEEIIVAGDSAGGGLCLTLMQYLRDAGLPQVGAAYLLSPWCDLTTSFESWNRNVRQGGFLSSFEKHVSLSLTLK